MVGSARWSAAGNAREALRCALLVVSAHFSRAPRAASALGERLGAARRGLTDNGRDSSCRFCRFCGLVLDVVGLSLLRGFADGYL